MYFLMIKQFTVAFNSNEIEDTDQLNIFHMVYTNPSYCPPMPNAYD